MKIFLKVRFSDGLGWEGWAEFNPAEVHKQYGIAFKTPKYRDGNIKEKTKVFLELLKPSDESVSDSQDFFFLPYEGSSYNLTASKAGKPYPAPPYGVNGGHYKDLKDLNIKQETVDHGWADPRYDDDDDDDDDYILVLSQTGEQLQ